MHNSGGAGAGENGDGLLVVEAPVVSEPEEEEGEEVAGEKPIGFGEELQGIDVLDVGVRHGEEGGDAEHLNKKQEEDEDSVQTMAEAEHGMGTGHGNGVGG